MNNFTYVRAESVDQALEATSQDAEARLLAGGTDLIPLMKDEIASPATLVDISSWKELSRIEQREDGLHIGALVRLSDIASSEEIRRSYSALALACELAATPQLRNMGTIGGNLLQQTRCWYYRGPYNCWLKGGDTCFARGGENELHSIFATDESPCVSAHPSDPAAALLALDASVKFRTSSGEQEVAIADFFALPEGSRRTFTTLPDGAIITEIVLPPARPGTKSVYLKAMQRASWAFALAGIALCITVEGARISEARIGLSGVAPIPLRARAAEARLQGIEVNRLDPESLAGSITEGARPLSSNRYKVALLRGLYKQALSELIRQ